MTCLCTDDRAHACSGGGVTPPGRVCACPCHRDTLGLLRQQLAAATRARPSQVDTREEYVHGAPYPSRVIARIAGRITVTADAANAADAALLATSFARRALDFGAPQPTRGEKRRRALARGAPISDTETHADLRGVEVRTKTVGPTGHDIAAYAEAAKLDPQGRACRVWLDVGPDLTGDLE